VLTKNANLNSQTLFPLMRFGFHIPISGGLDKVVQRAVQRHCDTLQIFTRSPRIWLSRPLKEDEVSAFRTGIREANIQPVVVHTQYLVNLASADPILWQSSWQSLAEDLRRAETLGAQFVVTHPGSRGVSPLEEGINRAGEAIRRAFTFGAQNDAPLLLLENTAGGGRLLGARFEELAAIAEAAGSPDKVGVCLDIAHAYQAGYDLASKEGLEAALEELGQTFGLARLKIIHANESATPLGSHRDRHWDIAEGFIGAGGFHLILTHPKLRHLPFIMETPTFELKRDLRNMRTIRRLARQSISSGNDSSENPGSEF
jgi:deoxyribonuclease-4